MLYPGMVAREQRAGKFGVAELRIDSPDPMERARAARDGQPLGAKKYARLIVNGHLYMTDAEFECWTNAEFIENARGDVLVAGLGIGLILGPILKLPRVTSVTVLEISPDVISLIAPLYKSPKLKAIVADAYKWEAPRKAFDCVYLDIWANVPNSDDRQDIVSLKKKYRSSLRPGGWLGVWCEKYSRK